MLRLNDVDPRFSDRVQYPDSAAVPFSSEPANKERLDDLFPSAAGGDTRFADAAFPFPSIINNPLFQNSPDLVEKLKLAEKLRWGFKALYQSVRASLLPSDITTISSLTSNISSEHLSYSGAMQLNITVSVLSMSVNLYWDFQIF